MDVNLICSNNLKTVLKEILLNRNITISSNASICIVQKGFELQKNKISIVFEIESLNILIDYLDDISPKEDIKRNMITGKYNDCYEIIKYEDILYFEGIKNEVFCVIKDKKYKIKEKLYQLEEELINDGFIRVNKSFVVNIAKVTQIIPWFNNKLLLKIEGIDIEIDVTRKYIKDFKRFLRI